MATAPRSAVEPKSHRPPLKYPGEEAADRFNDSFKALAAVSTIGASITFSQVVTAAPEPLTYHGFDRETIQLYMAISWLFFMLDLISTLVAGSILALFRPQTIAYWVVYDSRRRRRVMAWYSSAIGLLFLLLVLAFVFVDLVVVAYAGVVGWMALAFTGFIGVWGILFIIYQSPIGAAPPRETNGPSTARRRMARELLSPSAGGEKSETGAEIVPGYPADLRLFRSEMSRAEKAETIEKPPEPGTSSKELSADEEIKEVENNR